MANISKKFFYLFVFVLVIFVSGKFSAGSFIGVHKAYGYGGSSGGYSARVNAVPTAPAKTPVGYQALINNGAAYTLSESAVLNLEGGNSAKMAISNYSDFRDASVEPYARTKNWNLLPGEGDKIVYVKFYDSYGAASLLVQSKIKLVSSKGEKLSIAERIRNFYINL